MDPYFIARKTKLNTSSESKKSSNFRVDQPFLVIHTANFKDSPLCDEYDQPGCIEKFFNN